MILGNTPLNRSGLVATVVVHHLIGILAKVQYDTDFIKTSRNYFKLWGKK